jgi:hypothetical protein
MNLRPLVLACCLAALSCGRGSPAFAVVDNRHEAPAVVYRAWWSVTYFATPVPAGGESSANRVVTSTDYAYALLAPGWDPDAGAPPTTLVAVRTKDKLTVGRGATLHIAFSDETADGNCAAGLPLPQDVADLITKSVFPDEFSGISYDAATCTARPVGDAAGQN